MVLMAKCDVVSTRVDPPNIWLLNVGELTCFTLKKEYNLIRVDITP